MPRQTKVRPIVTPECPPLQPASPGLRALVDVTHDPIRDSPAVTARAISLRMAGLTMQQIADELHVSIPTVRKWLIAARKNATLLDITPLLDQVALPQAVDNLLDGLAAGNERYTLATLQGRGAFSAHTKQESHATSLELQIHVEMSPTPRTDPDVVQGQIVGQPRVLKDADA